MYIAALTSGFSCCKHRTVEKSLVFIFLRTGVSVESNYLYYNNYRSSKLNYEAAASVHIYGAVSGVSK